LTGILQQKPEIRTQCQRVYSPVISLRSSLLALLLLVAHLASANAADLSIVGNVELQPLGVSVRRVAQALEWEGSPLSETERAALEKAIESGNGDEAVD